MLTLKNNNITSMNSASEISLAGSIMQQLTSSSQSSSLSLASSLTTSSTKHKSLIMGTKLGSDQILSSTSNYLIQGGAAALAEAELDELDDVDYLDVTNENSRQLIANSTKTLTGGASDKCNDLITNQTAHKLQSFTSTTSNNNIQQTVILSPEEKVSNEAKEYWATIDLYNNSKMAFNKRLKSVKLKREKLNIELNQRNQTKEDTSLSKSKEHHQLDSDTQCTCVKCSINYHESIIKQVNDTKTCNKNQNEHDLAKQSTSSINSNTTISNNNEIVLTELTKKQDVNQIEEKLFNIKNELVNLSETSLDVFQLLLQLSDTMLDINTQLNSNQSAQFNQPLNTFLGSDANNFLYEEEEELEECIKSPKLDLSPPAHKSNLIEEFLSKTLNTSHSLRVNQTQANTSSISNIINTLNNRNTNRNGSFLSTPSQSFRSTLVKPFNKPLQLKQNIESSSSPSSVANLIENIYDKTSVTQFVDSLLNHNTSKKTQSINSIDETSNISDCCYSTLSSTNNEPVYQSIDADFLNKSKQITTTTSQILSRQPFIVSSKHQSFNLKNRETPFMKSSKSNCSSTSSSSSGCGGSSSICSSSNNDLTFMTNETNNRNSTSSTTSSVLASPMSLSASSSNNEILQTKKSDSSVSSSSSSNASSPQNSLVVSSSFYTNSSTLSNNQYKRSNSVSYKSITNGSTASSSSITNRKPSFKFESNILNKVQFMNMKKTTDSTNQTPLKSLNESTVLPSHLQDTYKRNSLGRDDLFEQSQRIIKRQQSINSSKSYQQQQQPSGILFKNGIKTPTAQSIIINQIKMNQHQMSLDSGIFLPSESEEFNSFNLVR